ncbi:type IV pilin protein [Leucothrix sargassi]|nr:type IV pilin protein [Leucothrix sargassi]
MKNNKKKGFSLIELMITVAILGILSAITVPSYMEYVRKTKRTEAKAEILSAAQLQESYYVQNLSYAVAASDLGYSSDTITTETDLYEVTVTGSPASCTGDSGTPCTGYTIQAVPKSSSSQASDKDCSGGFRLTNTGQKQAKSATDSAWTNGDTRDECWG